jgi:hypothetical protein
MGWLSGPLLGNQGARSGPLVEITSLAGDPDPLGAWEREQAFVD